MIGSYFSTRHVPMIESIRDGDDHTRLNRKPIIMFFALAKEMATSNTTEATQKAAASGRGVAS